MPAGEFLHQRRILAVPNGAFLQERDFLTLNLGIVFINVEFPRCPLGNFFINVEFSQFPLGNFFRNENPRDAMSENWGSYSAFFDSERYYFWFCWDSHSSCFICLAQVVLGVPFCRASNSPRLFLLGAVNAVQSKTVQATVHRTCAMRIVAVGFTPRDEKVLRLPLRRGVLIIEKGASQYLDIRVLSRVRVRSSVFHNTQWLKDVRLKTRSRADTGTFLPMQGRINSRTRAAKAKVEEMKNGRDNWKVNSRNREGRRDHVSRATDKGGDRGGRE